MAYNVVIEQTQEAGGYAGTRTWTSFRTENEFKEMLVNDPTTAVIAEGVTDEEARWLTSHTPESSRIKAAIAASFQQGHLNIWLFNHVHLPNAFAAILHDREVDPHGFFSQCSSASPEPTGSPSLQERLFAAVDNCSDPTSGRVNLERLPLSLAAAILDSLQEAAGPDDGDLLG